MMYILKDGKPEPCEDTLEWGKSLQENQRVDKRSENGVDVSTVFLGIDHSFGTGSPPILFETMVFGGKHNELQERYSTIEQAREGHQRICDMVFDGAANQENDDE